MRGVLVAVVLAGCSPPPLSLALAVSQAPANGCGAATCADITLACDAVVGIRILDPSHRRQPYISQCQDVVFDRDRDLCSLANIDLQQTPLPEQTLEVQVVVFPRDDVPRDAMDNPICPANVAFDSANGFPISPVAVTDPNDPTGEHWVRPAIGGRTYYHPGDGQTVVELGCPDLPAVNAPTCGGSRSVAIAATVTDLDTNQPVSATLANRLGVSIGEPELTTSTTGVVEYVLNPASTRPLDRTVIGPVPAWGASVDLAFASTACLEVLEDVPQATASLSCKRVSPADAMIDVTGVLVAKDTLDQILLALSNPPLDQGLTVGIVLDDLGPSPNRLVTTDLPGSIQYLSADGQNFNAPATTLSGIFVSQDAPFGTQFTTTNGTSTVFQLGGLVNNKITVVVLTLSTLPL